MVAAAFRLRFVYGSHQCTLSLPSFALVTHTEMTAKSVPAKKRTPPTQTPSGKKSSSRTWGSVESTKREATTHSGTEDASPTCGSSSVSYTFSADDFNFTGYSLPQLVFLCEHRLVLRTRFPKLVVALSHHPQLAEWLRARYVTYAQPNSSMEHGLVAQLVDCVNRHTVDHHGNLKHTTVVLDEPTCTALTTGLIGGPSSSGDAAASAPSDLPPAIQKAHEASVVDSVHRTLKQRHMWTDTTVPCLNLDIHTARRTKKRVQRSGAGATSNGPTEAADAPTWSPHQNRVIQIS